MSTSPLQSAVPAGTWQLDPTHSSAGFAVKHAVVNTFRSEFKDVAATLEAGADGTATLTGVVQVDSVLVDDENLKAHLLSPELFDADAFPTITFVSDSFTRQRGDLAVAGTLTLKGVSRRVEGRGEIADGAVDLYGNTRLGIALEAEIDRTDFGVSWNATLPKGGLALSHRVKLTLDLAFVQA